MVRRQAFDSGKGSTSGESRRLCIGDSHSCARKLLCSSQTWLGKGHIIGESEALHLDYYEKCFHSRDLLTKVSHVTWYKVHM